MKTIVLFISLVCGASFAESPAVSLHSLAGSAIVAAPGDRLVVQYPAVKPTTAEVFDKTEAYVRKEHGFHQDDFTNRAQTERQNTKLVGLVRSEEPLKFRSLDCTEKVVEFSREGETWKQEKTTYSQFEASAVISPNKGAVEIRFRERSSRNRDDIVTTGALGRNRDAADFPVLRTFGNEVQASGIDQISVSHAKGPAQDWAMKLEGTRVVASGAGKPTKKYEKTIYCF